MPNNPHTRSLTFLLAFTFAAFTSNPAEACFMRSPQPVQVWLDHITVDIVDQVAVKTYNCTFKNPNPQAIVGATCYMELEPGSQVDNMSVLVDGKETKAEILDVEKANKVFTEIVKNGGSPALLEYFGNQLIQTQVPRIKANGTVTVKLKYTTILKRKGDLIRMQMLNTNPKAAMQPLKSASVTVNIKSSQPIKNLYSPTHEITIEESTDWDVTAKWSQDDYLPNNSFVLYYQTTKAQLGASLVAHRELDEDGAFMMMLSPTVGGGAGAVTPDQILSKDVVFCVDTSGSMLVGGKMDQARAALRHCVASLRDGDRFNIVDFSTVARNFDAKGLVVANDESRAKALRYVDRLHARGGTAIEESLRMSLDHLMNGVEDESEAAARLKMIVFATDGLPTIGERDPQAILKKVSKWNTDDVRLFVFGEGVDVNTKLLDALALDHRGESDYVLPDEDVAKKITGFFDRVGSPIMTNVEIEFDGVEVRDIFSRRIPDVFKGEQVILYGRYRGHGEKTVRLTADVAGSRKTFEYKLIFPEHSENDTNAFVPRLWAGQKVDFLLNEIRKSETENKELIEEVAYLAKQYGIVTPYTSYLMVDDNCNMPKTAQVTNFVNQMRGGQGGLRGQAWGYAAVDNAKKQSLNRKDLVRNGNSASFYKQVDLALQQEGQQKQALASVRYVGNRCFYNVADTWYDSRYETDKVKDVQDVTIGSGEYVKLLNDNPLNAKYLAQGNVVLNVKGKWYRFQERKKS